MQIIVEGKATNFVPPDQVIMNFDFITKGNSYEEVLELGSRNVLDFIRNILEKHGFSKTELKTRNFIVREEKKYNEITRKYEFDGYSYNQNATLKFDYDKYRMASLMDDISKLDNSPFYRINFGLKNEREYRRSILKESYNDALEQACAIADASGKELKECLKVDFKPFTTEYISETSYSSDMIYAKKTMINTADVIGSTFTPEDIELTEKLYCLWSAE